MRLLVSIGAEEAGSASALRLDEEAVIGGSENVLGEAGNAFDKLMIGSRV